MKRKIFKLLKFLKKDNTKSHFVRIGLYALGLVLLASLFARESLSELVATGVSLCASALVLYTIKVLAGFFEDLFKVSRDTQYLLDIYKDSNYKKTVTLNKTEMVIAYDDQFTNRENLPLACFQVEDHPEECFQPDSFVEGNFAQLYSAHSNSFKMNADTIRLDDYAIKKEAGKPDVHWFRTSRSTYYNHLVTNRVADFTLFDDVTLRSMYEYRDKHTPLAQSKMSNHIGINALVYLSDGTLLVPRRDKESTISKNKVTSSIAVKLDLPKGTDELTREHLFRGTILDNLTSRLLLPKRCFKEEDVDIWFVGFGRNVYEAGKPQFYFEVHLKNINKEDYREFTKTDASGEKPKQDVDKCIYVVDPASMHFEKGKLRFQSAEEKKSYLVGYEMSYLCNFWQAAEARGENDKEENAVGNDPV